MVFFVADIDEPKGVCCYAPRIVEAAIRSALAPERSKEPSGRIQNLQSNGYRLCVKCQGYAMQCDIINDWGNGAQHLEDT